MGIEGPDGRIYGKDAEGKVIVIRDYDGNTTLKGLEYYKDRAAEIQTVIDNKNVGGKENNKNLN